MSRDWKMRLLVLASAGKSRKGYWNAGGPLSIGPWSRVRCAAGMSAAGKLPVAPIEEGGRRKVASPDDTAARNGNLRQTEESGPEKAEVEPGVLKNLNYALLQFGFSLLSLVNVLIFVLAEDQIVKDVVLIVDVPLTAIFLVDFVIRLRSAESKRAYFFREFGWADLLSSLPYPLLKVFRLFRVFRAWRLVGHYGARNLRREFRDHRADSALSVIAFLIICVSEMGGIFVSLAERTNPAANIKTASDAMWWAVVTIATVGYGDRYPTTDPGRLIGLVVMMTGVALLGVLTGYLANSFLAPPKSDKVNRKSAPQPPAQAEELAPEAVLAEMRRLLSEQEKAQEELRALLAEIKQGTR